MAGRSKFFTKLIYPTNGYGAVKSNKIVSRITESKKLNPNSPNSRNNLAVVNQSPNLSPGLLGAGGSDIPGNLQINGIWFKPVLEVDGVRVPGAPPQSITVSEENFIHKFQTLRTEEAAKINSGHSRSIIAISAVFTEEGINELLCPIIYSLRKYPLCFLENELLRRVLPTHPNEPIGAFVRSVNISTVPSLPGCLQASFQMIWFNHRPFVPKLSFRTKWFTDGTKKVLEELKKVGRSEFIIKYGSLGSAASAAIGNNYSDKIEDALPLLHYLYEGYDEDIPITALDEITPGYSLDPDELRYSLTEFVFPIFQAPMRVRDKKGKTTSIDTLMREREVATQKKQKPARPSVSPPVRRDPNFLNGRPYVAEIQTAGPKGTSKFKKKRATDDVMKYVLIYATLFDVPEAVIWAILDVESGGGDPYISNYKMHKKITVKNSSGKVVQVYKNVYAGTSATGSGQLLTNTYKEMVKGRAGAEWIGPPNLGSGFRRKKKAGNYQYLTQAQYDQRRKTDPLFNAWHDAKHNLKGQFDPKNNVYATAKLLGRFRDLSLKPQYKTYKRKGRWVRKKIGGPLFTSNDTVDWSHIALAYHDGYAGARFVLTGTPSNDYDRLKIKRGKWYRKKFNKFYKQRLKQATSGAPSAAAMKAAVYALAIMPGKIVKAMEDRASGNWILTAIIKEHENIADFKYFRGSHQGSAWVVEYFIKGKPTVGVNDTVTRGQKLGVALMTLELAGGDINKPNRILEVSTPYLQALGHPNEMKPNNGSLHAYTSLPSWSTRTVKRSNSGPGGPSAAPATIDETTDVLLTETEGLRRALRQRGIGVSDDKDRAELLALARAEIAKSPSRSDQPLTFLEGIVYLIDNDWILIQHEHTRKIAQHTNITFTMPKGLVTTVAAAVGFGNNLAVTPMSGHGFPTVQHMGGQQINGTINFTFVGNTALGPRRRGSALIDDPARKTLESFKRLNKRYQDSAIQFREFTRKLPVRISNNLFNSFGINHVFIDGLDVSTVAGRPHTLDVGMRMTATKPAKDPKARLVAHGNNAVDLTLIDIFVALVHHGYFIVFRPMESNGGSRLRGKHLKQMNEWWNEAEPIYRMDPRPSLTDSRGSSKLQVVTTKIYDKILSDTGGGNKICSFMKNSLARPMIGESEIKSEFFNVAGYRTPKSGDYNRVEEAYTIAGKRTNKITDVFVYKTQPGHPLTKLIGYHMDKPEKNVPHYKSIADSISRVDSALGMKPATEVQTLQAGNLSHVKIPLHLFMALYIDMGAGPGVRNLDPDRNGRSALLRIARYLASDSSIAQGNPGAKDFKAILEGVQYDQALTHPGVYADLKLPPSPITLESRDSNPDIFFYNSSDVEFCKPGIYRIIKGTPSPVRELVKNQEGGIADISTAIGELHGTDTQPGSIASGGVLADKRSLYGRTEALRRRQKCDLRFVSETITPGASIDDCAPLDRRTRRYENSDRRGYDKRSASIIASKEVAYFHPTNGSIPAMRNGTYRKDYMAKERRDAVDSGRATGADANLTPFSERRSLAAHMGNSPHVDHIIEIRNSASSHKSLEKQVVNRFENKDMLHLLDRAAANRRSDDMTLRRAFPVFQVLFIEEDSENIFLTTGFDDFYGVNAIEAINIVHAKNHAASTCTIQLLDLDGALYNRSFELAAGDKEKLGRKTGQINKKGKPVKEDKFRDRKNSPFFATMMKEGMKVMVKMGFENDPDVLETVFVGQLVQFNQGHRITMVCQSYGTELVAQRFGDDPSENVDFWNATAGDILHSALNREELRHFGRWRLQDATLGGRIFGSDELRPDGQVYSVWSWAPSPTDDNVFFPDFSESWGLWDKLWGHMQYVFWQTTIWEVFKEMELRIPGQVAYPVPYGDRMTMFFGNPNQQYLYRPPFSQSERLNELDSSGLRSDTGFYEEIAKGPLKHGSGHGTADTDTAEGRQNAYNNIVKMVDLKKDMESRGKVLATYEDYDKLYPSTALTYGRKTEAKFLHIGNKRDVAGNLLRMTKRLADLKRLANQYGGIVNGKLPKGIPSGEFWSALRAEHDGRIKPFRNWIYCSDFSHLIANNIRCDKTGTYNSIELKYTDCDDVDFDEFNDGEDVASMIINADDGIKPHHIRRDKRSFPNCNSVEAAERYGSQLVANSLKDTYKGELTMLGNPSIKPYDIIWMSDVYSGIAGPIEVNEVVHSFSSETGYICEVVPHMLVTVNESVTETMLKATGRLYGEFFGKQQRLYSAAAGQINFSDVEVDPANAAKLSSVGGAGGISPTGARYRRGDISSTEDNSIPGVVTGARVIGGSVGAIGLIRLLPLSGPIGLVFAAWAIYKLVNYSSTRQPVHITPLMKNNKPYILGIEGFENDTLMVSVGSKWKYFVEGVSDGWDVFSHAVSNTFSGVF